MRSKLPAFCGLILVVAACTAKKSDDATTQADTAAVAAATASTNPPGGTLPSGWETFRSAEFRDSVASIVWTPQDSALRECKNPSKCGGGETPAGIAANSDARLITPTNGGATGAVIVKMYLLGTGQHDTKHYDMKPNATNYVVVKADGAGGLRYIVVRVANSGDAKTDSVAGGPFKLCQGSGTSGPVHATWWGCKSHLLESAKTKSDSLKILKDAEYPDQDGWVSCAAGCCVLAT